MQNSVSQFPSRKGTQHPPLSNHCALNRQCAVRLHRVNRESLFFDVAEVYKWVV